MTDYNLSGAQDSWKLGLQWKPSDGLMLRGTDSQDIRAPDVLELFNSASTTVAQDLFPYSTAPTQSRVTGLNVTVGNPQLQPEIAHTVTVGIVLSPTWSSSWQSSVDYYHINIADAIENTSTQGIVDGCHAGVQVDCSLITLNGSPVTSTNGIDINSGSIVVTAPTENIGNESTSGFDLQSTYSHPMGPGTLSAGVSANYLLTFEQPTSASGCSSTELAGTIGGCLGFAAGYPRWSGNLSLQYATSQFSAYVREQIIGSGSADPGAIVGVDISRDMHVPVIEYTNLAFSYNLGFGGRGQIYLNVTNLLNKAPPVTATKATSWVNPTVFQLYDVLGRRFLLGYRLNL